MREAALVAEEQSKKKISLVDVEKALSKLDDFSIKSSAELEEDARFILSIVKKHSGKKIGRNTTVLLRLFSTALT